VVKRPLKGRKQAEEKQVSPSTKGSRKQGKNHSGSK